MNTISLVKVVAERFYRCLKGNNYLIALDDIWDIGAWKELEESFPDDENGSRIMHAYQ